MRWEIADHEPGAPQGATLLASVPVTRNTPCIVSEILLRGASPRLVASIQSDDLPPVSMAYEGVVSGPLQIWAIPGPAGLERASPELWVLASDVRLRPEALMGFCGELARWVRSKPVSFSLALEGVEGEPSQAPTYATTHAGEGSLRALGLDAHRGVHAGFDAAFLARFNQHRLPAAGVFVPSPGDMAGDAHAAVEALRIVEPFLPPGSLSGDVERFAQESSARLARRDVEQASARRNLDAQAEADPSYA